MTGLAERRETGERHMAYSEGTKFAAICASIALAVFAGGCAAQTTGAGSGASEPAAAVSPSQLTGTWRGEVWPVGTDSTSVLNSDAVLEIKDDATYRLVSTRRGTATNDSGVVVRDGNVVILRSSAGQPMRLARNGDKLYGVVTSSGRAMNIMMERTR
jgi:hypothetical protein